MRFAAQHTKHERAWGLSNLDLLPERFEPAGDAEEAKRVVADAREREQRRATEDAERAASLREVRARQERQDRLRAGRATEEDLASLEDARFGWRCSACRGLAALEP